MNARFTSWRSFSVASADRRLRPTDREGRLHQPADGLLVVTLVAHPLVRGLRRGCGEERLAAVGGVTIEDSPAPSKD
jgi:hypothetical protein